MYATFNAPLPTISERLGQVSLSRNFEWLIVEGTFGFTLYARRFIFTFFALRNFYCLVSTSVVHSNIVSLRFSVSYLYSSFVFKFEFFTNISSPFSTLPLACF